MDDYYALLGISPSATNEELKRAYREMTRKFHPDVNSEATAPILFRAIAEAYECLSNPKSRNAYDEYWISRFAKDIPEEGANFVPPIREEQIFPKEEWDDVAQAVVKEKKRIRWVIPAIILPLIFGFFTYLITSHTNSNTAAQSVNSSSVLTSSIGSSESVDLAPNGIGAQYTNGGAKIYWDAPKSVKKLIKYIAEISVSAGPWKLIATVPPSQLSLSVMKVNGKGWTSFRIASVYLDGRIVGGKVFGLPGEFK